ENRGGRGGEGGSGGEGGERESGENGGGGGRSAGARPAGWCAGRPQGCGPGPADGVEPPGAAEPGAADGSASTSHTAAASASSVVSSASRAGVSPAARTAAEVGGPMVMIGIEGCTPTAAAWRAIIGLVSTSALYPPVA